MTDEYGFGNPKIRTALLMKLSKQELIKLVLELEKENSDIYDKLAGEDY